MLDATLHTIALTLEPPSDDGVARLVDMASGYPLSRCLHIVADLGVADALDETPRTASELAAAVRVQPDALWRRTPGAKRPSRGGSPRK